jgi:hypothetical protein
MSNERNLVNAWPALKVTTKDGETHYAEIYPGSTNIEHGFRVLNESGDLTWMPTAEFEQNFRRVKKMSFGLAIEAVKRGAKIARAGWNGKNQYVELMYCVSYKNSADEVVNANHCNIGNKALAFVGTSGVQIGWLASQADMLADDWMIVG